MKMNKHILIVTSLLAAAALQAQEIKVKDKIVEKSDNALIIRHTGNMNCVVIMVRNNSSNTPLAHQWRLG